MINIDKIVKTLEKFAPLELAESWDNSGWQINLGNNEAKKILLALTLTPSVLNQAIENGCDFIITHHPLIFNGLKSISTESVTEKLIINCIKNHIQVYSAHTNLDATKGGVNDVLCEKLGLIKIENLSNFVRVGEFSEEMTLDAFVLKLKISLNAVKLKLINPQNLQTIKKVALCAGSGGDFISQIHGVDAYVTGDIKYHNALDVQNMVLVDAGHFETEKIVLQTLKNLLHKTASDIMIAKEHEPWLVV